MSNINQKSRSKITARKWYTDIDLNLTAHPSSRDLSLKYDKDAVKRSLRNIMLTNNFERPFKPNFGANLRGLLFELADDITKYEIRSQIMEAVEAYEPRVRVNQIDLQQSRTGNDMHVSLIYGIVGIQEPQQVEVILQRVR
tara:strand:+ start:200 stop:622 length:423 start_codon:yes stop_codon:yes gene_type:complete